mmetsp:Transcript_13240/g.14621  ORF Transcript_13240/g.14621 Transcript_13240/m.14621 type:complete len:84 (+) Transcript_13240:735-986(+)
MARAIATRCFCPPDNFSPFGPTTLWKPSFFSSSPSFSFSLFSSPSMKLNALALSAANRISSIEASFLPTLIFSSMVVLKRTGS